MLLAPTIATADDFVDAVVVQPPPPRFRIGFQLVESLQTVSYGQTDQMHQFGSPQQYNANTELDVPATFRVTPWLRAEALVGFTELGLAWNDDCAPNSPCLHDLEQDAIVVGGGAQAFYRRGDWEAYAELVVRAPIAFGRASTAFYYQSGDYGGRLDGGDSIALAAGVARRVDTARIFAELGYLQSFVAVQASELGLSTNVGGVLLAAGISLW